MRNGYINWLKCLLLISTMFACLNVCAEYKTLIRYDRVWENVSYYYDGDLVKCLKFDGTEELNGKTYHKIVAFKHTVRTYDGSLGQYVYSTPVDVYEPEGYMREEDGVVYTLVVVTDKHDGVVYTCPEDLMEGFELTEQVIYNFNVDENDIFEMYSFVMRSGLANPFKAFAIESVDIAGEECKKIDFGPGALFNGILDFIGGYSYIEGIGAIEYGCLNYTEFITQPTKIWYYNTISRVFDMHGNVIFTTPGDIIGDGLEYGEFSIVDDLSDRSGLVISDCCISYGEENKINSINIYDLNGKSVKSSSKIGQVSVDTSALQPGIYIVTTFSDGKLNNTRKFTKK